MSKKPSEGPLAIALFQVQNALTYVLNRITVIMGKWMITKRSRSRPDKSLQLGNALSSNFSNEPEAESGEYSEETVNQGPSSVSGTCKASALG